jgi:HAE1 family hydrophobic/amphiphilic exporter-1
LSLADSVRLALEHNLDIKIALHDTRIARFNLEGSYSYYDPVLTADARHTKDTTELTQQFQTGNIVFPGDNTSDSLTTGIQGATPWGMRYDIGSDLTFLTRNPPYNRSYNADVGILVTQPLLRGFWVDGGRSQIQISKKQLKISEYDFALKLMQTIHDVEQGYFNLIAAQDRVKVQEKAVELADRLLAENKKRVEVGTMAPLEEKQAESQAATTRADLINAVSLFGTAERVLKNLITDHYEQWFASPIQPTDRLLAIPEDFNLQASWLEGLTLRPDFNRAREEVERQGIEVRLAKNAVYPSLDLVGSYGRRGIDRGFSGALADVRDENLPRYSYGVQFSIPLFNRGARYNLRAAKERMIQLEDSLRQAHQRIIVEIDNAVGVARSAYERVAATRAAREYAEAALLAEEKKYENGRSTSFNVLRLQRDLTQARSDEIGALADYNRALSDLYFREGTTLEKNRIELK